jgi:carboxyl-terminal processing protease
VLLFVLLFVMSSALLIMLPLMSVLNSQSRRLHLLAPSLLASCLLIFMPATQAQDDLSPTEIPTLSSDEASDITPDLNSEVAPELAPELKQELHPSLDADLAPLIPENALTPTDDTEVKGKLALEDLRSFVTAFNHIRNAYVEEVDDKTLLQNAIKGMLTELDPHSNYLEPESYEDLQVSASGEFGGLGLEVGLEDGLIIVISPIDDTPAQKAGMESGDLIIKIDNQPVKGLGLGEAVKKMRGPKGSSIDLTIVRQGVPQPIELTLIRDVISVVSVRSRVLEEHYAYLRIAQFQGNTGADLKKALAKLKAEKNINGVILDLRNNPGGVLQAAVEVVDAFIEEGLVVYTEGRIRESASRFEARPGDETFSWPLVVLINGGSASASEIVAGALQDHNRAIILGTNSFGKGSVQTVIQLSETRGMKLTTARYFTPKGRSIQAQGIVPDIIVERAKITKLKPKGQIFEADLHGHLESINDRSSSKEKSEVLNADEELVTKDNQLYEALTLLKGLNILSGNKYSQE